MNDEIQHYIDLWFVGASKGVWGDELFYLQTLLAVVKGPTSFEDLCQFNGNTYPTFYEACLARGLLEDDSEWRQCLLEASYMQMGMRTLQWYMADSHTSCSCQPKTMQIANIDIDLGDF